MKGVVGVKRNPSNAAKKSGVLSVMLFFIKLFAYVFLWFVYKYSTSIDTKIQ
jgi:preprotein translocase subunit SecF